MTPTSLGERIKTYRERLSLSPADLAQQARIDVALVSALEANEVYPAIGTLARIARALGQRLGTFMDDQFREDPLIVRQADRRRETAARTGAPDQLPYHYYPLGKGKTDRHMEPFFVEVEPGLRSAPSSHEGEEFLVCLTGRLQVSYGGVAHVLEPGDSIYYNSIVPHEVSALPPGKAELYGVLFAPF
jgi:transcriptional regulator with XRE-family HTH domain